MGSIRYSNSVKTTAPPDPRTRTPKFQPPPLACDAHCHVFGPALQHKILVDNPARLYGF
jgi:predicted TIM-barrel fold metal-dependent hydrolase